MYRMNRMISTIVLTCFLFNTAFSDLAFGLAAPLATSDIVGIEYKDIARIKIALETQLMAVRHPIDPRGERVFWALGDKRFKENTIFQPADIQFFFSETKLTTDGLMVKCRVKDNYGLRTYYTAFLLERDKDGGFPMWVYTEKQYKDAYGKKEAPRMDPQSKDAKTMDR